MRKLLLAASVLFSFSALANPSMTPPPPGDARGQPSMGYRLERQELMDRLDELSLILQQMAKEDRRGKRMRLAEKAEQQLAWIRHPRERVRMTLPPPQPLAMRTRAVEEIFLADFCKALAQEPFSRDRLRLVAEVAPQSYFLVSQVERILGHFDFSNDRLEAARLLGPRLVDPANRFKLYSAFEFSSDKEKLRQILGG
jgi:hypothetical protein